jgi:predicted glutamine amidotransferase
MTFLDIITLLVGTAEEIVPIFIHNSQSQKIEGAIVGTANNLLTTLMTQAAQPTLATAQAAQAAQPTAASTQAAQAAQPATSETIKATQTQAAPTSTQANLASAASHVAARPSPVFVSVVG